MIVITDTTPLRYLAVLGELEILPRLFGEVLCPVEVLAECRDEAAPETLRVWATNPPGWLKVIEAGQVDEWLGYLAAAGRLIGETNFRASPAVIEVTWNHSGGGT